MSGPVLDRLDLQVEVPALTASELADARPGESTAKVAQRVLAARERQAARGALNAHLPTQQVRSICALDAAGASTAADAVDRAGFSARGIDRALRVARTIADLAGYDRVDADSLTEALQYRAYEVRRFGVRVD